MNTKSENTVPAKKKPEQVVKNTGIKGSGIVFIIALLALIISCYAAWAVRNLSLAGADRETEFTSLEAKLNGYRAGLEQLQNAVREIKDRIAVIAGQQDTLNESVSVLYKNRANENLDWAAAEIEHLIVIAVHNLVLEHNVTTALAALQSADDRLKNLGDPGLVDVRRQLAEDMNALHSVKPVDITGLSLFLADLVTRAETLPLKDQPVPDQSVTQTETVNQEQQSTFRKLLHEIWLELKSLVVITRTGSGSRALLLPEERYFLYQNLRLQLESARTAALRRDTANFHASLEIVIDWLNDYFDGTDPGISNITESLREMLGLELDPDLPDISSSLESLRIYIKDRSGPLSPGEAGPAP